MQQQRNNRIAQSVLNLIAGLMFLGGLYLVIFQPDYTIIGSANLILGASLLPFKSQQSRR